MAITWYDDVDAQITAAIALSAAQGSTSAATQVDVWNNRSGTGASTLVDQLLEVSEIVDDQPVTSGTEALDQHHVEARVVSGLNQTVTPTGWTRIGTARWLSLPPMANDTGLRLELRLSPPTYATSTQVRVNLHLITRSSRPIPLGISEAAGDGIYHGLGDGGYSALASFGGLAENPGGADDQVSVGDLRWIYQGRPHALLAHLLTFDDQDGSAAALASGESYIAVLTAAAGTLTVTKGDKGATPTRPDAPAGELLIGAVEVPFGLVITDAEITDEWLIGLFGHQAASLPVASLTFTIGAGDALIDNRLAHKDGSQDITLADDDVSEVWLLPGGNPSATVDGSKPDSAAQLLFEVTTASGSITAVVDRRVFTPQPQTLFLVSDAGAVAANEAAHGANPHAREWGLMPIRPVSLWLRDAGASLTGGETRVDVEQSQAGAAWGSLYAAAADMPDVAFDDAGLEDHDSLPDTLIVASLARLRARVDAVPTGGGGETLPDGYTVALRGWPL